MCSQNKEGTSSEVFSKTTFKGKAGRAQTDCWGTGSPTPNGAHAVSLGAEEVTSVNSHSPCYNL